MVGQLRCRCPSLKSNYRKLPSASSNIPATFAATVVASGCRSIAVCHDGKVPCPAPRGFRTVAQKKQAAANEEAKNAARAAKRQKAKAQAAKAATVDAITQDTTEVGATAVPAVIPLQPVRMLEVTASQGRKRKREDKLSRGMKQLNESGRSSSGFDF